MLTVDTEPDNAWENHLNPSVANVRELLRLQNLLAKTGTKATCLVTTRVIENPEATDVLRDLLGVGGEVNPRRSDPDRHASSLREGPRIAGREGKSASCQSLNPLDRGWFLSRLYSSMEGAFIGGIRA